MAERSLRFRLKSRSGSKTMAEVVDTGITYEGVRAVWFSRYGLPDQTQDCLDRQRRLELLLEDITQENQ